MIISAFPGTGKSYFTKLHPEICGDSDSSKFSHHPDGTKNDNFINDYMDHIIKESSHRKYLFISSHEDVRKELIKRNIQFVLIYPDRSLKDIYLERYKERGSPAGFVKLLDEKWDEFIDSCKNINDGFRITLKEGEYISDYIHLSPEKDVFGDIIIQLIKDNMENRDAKVEIYRALCNVRWVNTITNDEYSCSWRYAGGLIADTEGNFEDMAYCDYYCSGGEGNVANWIADELIKYNWVVYEHN